MAERKRSGQNRRPHGETKKDSREKGEIARSKELNTLAMMLAGAGAC
jgi:flagellar biosynthetic protein FlhB